MMRSFVRGFTVGAVLTYMFDPSLGRRRRALLRDKVTHLFAKGEHWIDTAFRDMGHRAQGVVAEAGWLFRRDRASDRVVEERVRAKLGRACSHPGAIDARVRGGRVTLEGPVLRAEAEGLVAAVRGVRGVQEVESRLEVHREAGDEPALQGGKGRPVERPELLQVNWAPATRLIMAALGGCLFAYGASRRGLLARAAGWTGLAAGIRSVTNLPLHRVIGLGAGHRALDLRKSIRLNAPPDRVFEFWRDVGKFPSFMAHVHDVRDLGGGRFRWTVDGPAGVPVRWDAVITKAVPGELLAWKTEPGSAIRHAGIIRFLPEGGGTRVDIRMTYNPPAGVIGGALAAVLGTDPKSRLDEDLVRMKTLIETGRHPHDAARREARAEEPLAARR